MGIFSRASSTGIASSGRPARRSERPRLKKRERVGQVGRALGVGVHGLLEQGDRLVVATLVHQREALVVEVRRVGRLRGHLARGVRRIRLRALGLRGGRHGRGGRRLLGLLVLRRLLGLGLVRPVGSAVRGRARSRRRRSRRTPGGDGQQEHQRGGSGKPARSAGPRWVRGGGAAPGAAVCSHAAHGVRPIGTVRSASAKADATGRSVSERSSSPARAPAEACLSPGSRAIPRARARAAAGGASGHASRRSGAGPLAALCAISTGRRPHGLSARQGLVGHRGQRVDVGGRAGLVALELLGRHVHRRAEHHAAAGDARALHRRGDPQIGELGHAVLADQDVGRLHVAVHDARLVSVIERGSHVADHRYRGLLVERPLGDRLLQRLSLHVLHDDQHRLPVGGHVVDGHEVGVVERGAHPGLPLETLSAVLQAVGVQGLDGHAAAQPLVLGQHHPGHASHPDGAELAVAARDQFSGFRRHPLAIPARTRPENTRAGHWPAL